MFSNDQFENTNDLLIKAIAARRDMQIPDGPPQDVLEQTLQRLNAAGEPGRLRLKWPVLSIPALRRLAVAAVVAIAIGAGIYFAAFRNPAVVFADVLNIVNAAKCVSFDGSGTLSLPGGKTTPFSTKTWVTDAGQMRQVNSPSGMVTIVDWNANKWLTLNPASHTAAMIDMTNTRVPMQQNLFQQFKALDSKSAVPIGPRDIDGHKTHGFSVVSSAGDLKVWADDQSHEPVLMEETMKIPFLPPTTMTLSNFDWNAQIDESLLSLEPPQGYTVTNTTMNMGAASEAELLTALKETATLNGGRFPRSFDIVGISGALAVNFAKQSIAKTATQQDLQKQAADEMSVISRGLLFISDPKSGTDWHYAGKDVELGKVGVPIVWYRPAGSSGYRVIDADLSVHDVPADALPSVPSIPMGLLPTTAPSPSAK